MIEEFSNEPDLTDIANSCEPNNNIIYDGAWTIIEPVGNRESNLEDFY